MEGGPADEEHDHDRDCVRGCDMVIVDDAIGLIACAFVSFGNIFGTAELVSF